MAQFNKGTFKTLAGIWEVLDDLVRRVKKSDDPTQLAQLVVLRNVAFSGMMTMAESFIQHDRNMPLDKSDIREAILFSAMSREVEPPMPEKMDAFNLKDLVESTASLLKDQVDAEKIMGVTRAKAEGNWDYTSGVTREHKSHGKLSKSSREKLYGDDPNPLFPPNSES